MAQLEWRSGEKEHSLEYPRQWPPRDFVGVSLSVLGAKQRGQSSISVLEMMGFVENQQWKSESRFGQTFLPELANLVLDDTSGIYNVIVKILRHAKWDRMKSVVDFIGI